MHDDPTLGQATPLAIRLPIPNTPGHLVRLILHPAPVRRGYGTIIMYGLDWRDLTLRRGALGRTLEDRVPLGSIRREINMHFRRLELDDHRALGGHLGGDTGGADGYA